MSHNNLAKWYPVIRSRSPHKLLLKAQQAKGCSSHSEKVVTW